MKTTKPLLPTRQQGLLFFENYEKTGLAGATEATIADGSAFALGSRKRTPTLIDTLALLF